MVALGIGNHGNRLQKSRNYLHSVLLIKSLNKEIKSYFVENKTGKVKRAISGNKNNIWKAVKMAKNLSQTSIPSYLTFGGLQVPVNQLADSFASHFQSKVSTNVLKTKVNSSVYNGKCQLIVQNRNFMNYEDVKYCLNELSSKKCEGFDQIPVCALFDARAVLLNPLSALFEKIYKTTTIPDQWKVTLVIVGPFLKLTL